MPGGRNPHDPKPGKTYKRPPTPPGAHTVDHPGRQPAAPFVREHPHRKHEEIGRPEKVGFKLKISLQHQRHQQGRAQKQDRPAPRPFGREGRQQIKTQLGTDAPGRTDQHRQSQPGHAGVQVVVRMPCQPGRWGVIEQEGKVNPQQREVGEHQQDPPPPRQQRAHRQQWMRRGVAVTRPMTQ